MNKSMSNLKPFIDELGEIKAQMAELKKRTKSLVATLKEAGIKAEEGELFRVVLSEVEDFWGTDWENVAMKFKPSRQLIQGNQVLVRKGYTRVNVYARTGEEANNE